MHETILVRYIICFWRAQGMYWAWRSAFVAQVRKILGEDAIILANSGGAVSDPSLSGITIEMESCVGTLSREVSVPITLLKGSCHIRVEG